MEIILQKSMIAGIQTVPPAEVTKHRRVRSISGGDPLGAGIFQRTLNIVTYYKHAGDSGDRGWLVAGWMKESLGRALTEHPIIAGRLRWRRKTTTPDEDGLEVVGNDCGVRLVEARFRASLPEFFEMVKRCKTRAEAETVFWTDIDEVTSFEGGGYSVGISCSILLADILLKTDFLTKWTQIQSSLAHWQATLRPLFYLPSNKRINFLTELSSSASVLDRGDPFVFLAETCSKMSLVCMKKAVANRETDRASVFLFVKEQGGDENGTNVEIHTKDEAFSDCDCGDDLEVVTDVGVLDVSLAFGDEFVGSSCWIGSISKGVVFGAPCTKSLIKFIIASPDK